MVLRVVVVVDTEVGLVKVSSDVVEKSESVEAMDSESVFGDREGEGERRVAFRLRGIFVGWTAAPPPLRLSGFLPPMAYVEDVVVGGVVERKE